MSGLQRVSGGQHGDGRGPTSAIDAWRAAPRPARPVLRELVIHGPQSRTDLARRLGLSSGSLTRLTKPLVESGLVVERDVRHDPVNGRPTRPLEVVADRLLFLGLKLTPDRVHATLTTLRAEVVARESAPLTAPSPEEVVAVAGRLADLLTAAGGPAVAAGVTFGGDGTVPALVEESELVDSGILGWQRVPIRRLMADRLGVPCFVKNDVAALAHSYHWFGEARGVEDFAVVTAGDGVGYALFVHGRAMRMTEADVGEFGHQILDPGGPMCPAGHRGCASSYVTTRSILMTAAQGMRRFPTYREVLRLASDGDPVCREAVRQAAWGLGAVIANVVNGTTVKRVFLAGEGADVARGWRADVDAGLAARRRDTAGVEMTVRPHDFHDWARGAAVVAIRAHVSDAG
ncbi:ROK family transcriptional regulator [Streptomyces hainanensis]|uniref:ROK family transcriptional regulator n=1 Tax=Streptomyces hainanensis TaxID=402648 RepID=A0A4R4TQK1_9ACTN|nr:ROK family transcriptional regulator [Streptomyces hainanensis]TDC80260.1 ROK family transcriptional regulator [Streptomyces hainanensis]